MLTEPIAGILVSTRAAESSGLLEGFGSIAVGSVEVIRFGVELTRKPPEGIKLNLWSISEMFFTN
jgi:hypothetical protein